MYDVLERLKFLQLLINNCSSHKLSEKSKFKWELEFNSIVLKYLNNPKYNKQILKIIKNNEK